MSGKTTYELIGGEAGVALTERFYQLMGKRSPVSGNCANSIPRTWRGRGTSCSCFFPAGWGPDLFVEKYGHPDYGSPPALCHRYPGKRDQWVACMVLAMEEVGIEETLRQKLLENFFQTRRFHA